MFRTRDFILLVVTIAFLVISIVATITWQPGTPDAANDTTGLAETAPVVGVAVAELPAELAREERLAAMREKVAASAALQFTATPAAEPAVPTDTTPTTTPTDPLAPLAQHCSQYAPFTGQWPLYGMYFEVSEGARVLYLENDDTVALDGATATVARDILMQLPATPLLRATPTCLATDVVGVATDGSLIRNHETGLYGIFGEETLIGYALDGFPIYGKSAQPTDTCGGTPAAGSYRYYLSAERETVLNCFMAPPITF